MSDVQAEINKLENHERIAIQRIAYLKKVLANLESEKEKLTKEMEELAGFGFGVRRNSGILGKIRRDLQDAKLRLEDVDKLVVVYTDGTSGEDIVAKVTAKRIYVGQPGQRRGYTIYHKTGKPVSEWVRQEVDLTATFGEDHGLS